MPASQTIARLTSSLTGLSSAGATQRLAFYGPNAIRTHGVRPLAVLLRQLRNPLLILLGAATLTSLLVGERTGAIIILVIVGLSVGLGFFNEYRSELVVEALHASTRHRALALRDGHPLAVDAVAPDSWKSKHISARGEVSVTVPVRRGGVLSLLLPIPPATVSFHASAKVQPAGSPEARSALKALAPLLPAERKDTGSIIEVIPEGAFLTYGLGASLSEMRNPAAARGRVPAR